MTADSQRSIPRQLMSLALPIIGINLLEVGTLAVDTAMCGRLAEAETALTGLGFATQVIFLLIVAMIGLSIGTSALVSRAYGAGDFSRVNHLVVQATTLTVGLAIAIGVVGVLFARPILGALGASGAAADSGAAYLIPLLVGGTFTYLRLLYSAVLRGVGNTRLPFVCTLASNILNVGLNYCLIFGNLGFPALGVRGAAIGTVISHLFNLILLVALVRRGAVDNLRLPVRLERIDRPLAAMLGRISWPVAVDMITLNATFLSIVAMLGRIDDASVAANGIGLRLQSLAFMPGLGIALASMAMVGHALGSGSVDRARQVTRSAVVLCLATMSVLAIPLVLLPGPLIALFDIEPGTPLAHYSATWLLLLGCGLLPSGVQVALKSTLQGAGATLTCLWIGAIATFLFQIPAAALLGFVFEMGAFGIWLSFPLSFALQALLLWVAYRRKRWAVVGTTPA